MSFGLKSFSTFAFTVHPSSAFAFASSRRVISLSRLSSEQRVYLLSQAFIDTNRRRPCAFEAFARLFLSRVYAEFAALVHLPTRFTASYCFNQAPTSSAQSSP
jgi:hypothetical protein